MRGAALRAAAAAVAVAIAISSCTAAQNARPSPSTTTPAPAPSPSSTREERWAEDVAYLLDRMEAIHPDLYHGVSRQALHDAADALVAEVPDLEDDEVLVGVMRLVALVSSNGRDGHMGLWPPDNPDAVHRFPIRVWQFPEGLFVTAARRPNENLVGSRILSVDGVPIDEVLRRLDPVVPRDNASNLRAARTVFLTGAEVLHGLGIAPDAASMVLEVEGPDGARREAVIGPVDAEAYARWVGGWELALPERPGLRFPRGTATPFRVELVPSSRALYVQYNVVEETSEPLVDEIEAAVRGRRVARVVLDLRSNGGGEADGYLDLLHLMASPRIDRPGGLFVLIGRLTFSAAASFVVLLDETAPHAVLVGEATGGAPSFWADPVTVTLPNSGLNVVVPDRAFDVGGSGERRPAVEPDIAVPLTAAAYFSGRDPVLERALSA